MKPVIWPLLSKRYLSHRRKITRIVEVLGVENDRYVPQTLCTYNVDLGQLEATPARAGWEEHIRQGLTYRYRDFFLRSK
ncbi:MAG: hypothetical protein L6R45_24035 [Anaerolineae bacterium]|nr:hypothetical protein [Anaerolineae bacterium]